VIHGEPLPDNWTGKMWAVAQGIDRAEKLVPDADYLLLTDADIEHSPDSLRRLAAKAERENLDLASLMVRLRVRRFWEKLLIPAFIFFFQKLFPFPRVNDPGRPEAAAAGGCMLVRRDALFRIGGVASIRDRVIDDCALAAKIKPGGAIWLGLAEDSHSLRGYDGLRGLWDMVARTAFVQLKNSYILLFGTIFGMVVLYLTPILAVLMGAWLADFFLFLAGLLAWICMTYLYLPTVRLYGVPHWQAIFLPVAALFYTAMTVDSAWRTWRGRGAGWKGRSYAPPSAKPERQVGE
jgi:hopene-associated glycosyltransferase HpnB